MTPSDEARAALREAYDELGLDIPLRLVEDCYDIERRYQYEDDPDLRLDSIRRAVTVAVEEDLRSSSDTPAGSDQ